MHIEVSVALNFVISYLYNKLPRRRVNIFGEELEKALKEKFQGHWYPEKPFKGSAFRCLKTGDPTDAVLERAARESGVPISDILENLPNELSVWIDPGEVSYRIGEKGTIKILISESHDRRSDDTSSADREVTKTFNPEAQCFRPIDAVNTSMIALSLSPKSTPQNSPPTPVPSPANSSGNYIKNSNGSPSSTTNGTQSSTASSGTSNSIFPRSHMPLTFTTASFAATKFGSTKLKTNSKRTNSRMSPTEFSNYIKQRAIQQQSHHSHSVPGAVTSVICPNATPSANCHLNSIGPVSPDRSLSPNPLSAAIINSTTTTNTNSMPTRTNLSNDSYYYSKPAATAASGAININTTPVSAVSMYSPPPPPPPTQFGRSNLFDANNSFVNVPPQNTVNSMATNSSFYSNGYGSIGTATATPAGKYSPFIDTNNYYGMSNGQQQQQQSTNKLVNTIGAPASHINGMTNGHHQTLESNLNTGNINLLVAN